MLHDCFASHRKATNADIKIGAVQVGKAQFHCNCNSIVVSSPFIETDYLLTPAATAFFVTDSICNLLSHPVDITLLSRLRGPPAFLFS